MKKLILIFLGLVYYLTIQVNLGGLKEDKYRANVFSFSIKSNVPHIINLHLGTDKYKISSVICGKAKIRFDNTSRLWFEHKTSEEKIALHIGKGKVNCKAEVRNKGRYYMPMVKQKLTTFNYVVLFILIAYPLIYFMVLLLSMGLDKLKDKVSLNTIEYIPLSYTNNRRYVWFIGMLLLLGMGLRILYFQKFGVTHFQHDWQGHIGFVKYISTHWSLPLPSKGLQFPQQPLYYFVTAGLYQLCMEMGMTHMQSIYSLGYFSLFCSFVFLYYGYRFFTLLTSSKWVQTVAVLFIVLTPSLVYMSARINNDVLVLALSAFSLHYIVRSYQSNFQQDFYKALIGVSLLFMTKISAVPLELLFFALLLMAYIQQDKSQVLKKKLLTFSVLGMFLLGLTLLRVYLPIENVFHFVNSSGHFPGQHIPVLDGKFFTYFDIKQLFTVQYNYTYMEDTSTYTFLNHQYRTMFLGEFDYDKYVKSMEVFKVVTQSIFLLGFVYVVGFFVFIRYLFSARTVEKLLFLVLIINLLLIISFVVTFPSICNTDFRYFVPSFLIFAYIFSQGLRYMSVKRWIQYIVSILLGLLVGSEVLFFSMLLT